jgi:hypothetical protein
MPKLSLLTLNARGLCLDSAFSKLLYEAVRWKRKRNLAVLCIQEHNLPPSKADTYRKQAIAAGYTLNIAFGSPDDPESTRRGVLILTADEIVTAKAPSVLTPGLIRQSVMWGDRKLDVACVYAPSHHQQRVDFFKTLKDHLTPETYIGGDWNCVPDISLDVDSVNPLAYHTQNRGASQLEDAMSDLKLSDERRYQLGQEAEFTHKQLVGPIGSQTLTSTRFDRWYTPDMDDLLCEFEVLNEFIYKKKKSDHYAVLLTLMDRDGDMGHERETFREEVMEDRTIQDEVKRSATKAWDQNKGKSYTIAWSKMNDVIYRILRRETNKRKHKERIEETRDA